MDFRCGPRKKSQSGRPDPTTSQSGHQVQACATICTVSGYHLFFALIFVRLCVSGFGASAEKCSLYQFFGTHDWAWIKDGGYETSAPSRPPSAPGAGCPEEAKENLSPELGQEQSQEQGQEQGQEQAKLKPKESAAAKGGVPVLQWQEGVAILEGGGVSLVNKKLLGGIQEVHDLLAYNGIPEIWWKATTISWIGDGPPPKPFTTVRRNVYVSATKPRRPDKGDEEACVCKPSDDSCGSRCINRASFILCDPRTCPCGKECTNLPFNARKTPPVDVFFTGTRGHGVRARKPIKEDTFVVEYTGDVINDADCEKRLRRAKRDREHNFYFMQLDYDTVIDARYRGSIGRFLNSSCRPNCETQKWRDSATNEIRVGIFTTRDIEKGEELTYNYNFQHFGNSRSKSFHCLCGASGCIGSLDAKKAKRRKTK